MKCLIGRYFTKKTFCPTANFEGFTDISKSCLFKSDSAITLQWHVRTLPGAAVVGGGRVRVVTHGHLGPVTPTFTVNVSDNTSQPSRDPSTGLAPPTSNRIS